MGFFDPQLFSTTQRSDESDEESDWRPNWAFKNINVHHVFGESYRPGLWTHFCSDFNGRYLYMYMYVTILDIYCVQTESCLFLVDVPTKSYFQVYQTNMNVPLEFLAIISFVDL